MLIILPKEAKLTQTPISGAPILALLAIDSRIVAASIEFTFNQVTCALTRTRTGVHSHAFTSKYPHAHTSRHQSMDMEKTNVSGYEYMDKAVQLPFSLPLPPQDKVT